jgi:hypothetical protein
MISAKGASFFSIMVLVLKGGRRAAVCEQAWNGGLIGELFRGKEQWSEEGRPEAQRWAKWARLSPCWGAPSAQCAFRLDLPRKWCARGGENRTTAKPSMVRRGWAKVTAGHCGTRVDGFDMGVSLGDKASQCSAMVTSAESLSHLQ